MSNESSRTPSTCTAGRSFCKISKPSKYGKKERYGKIQGSAGERHHGVGGMPGGLARRHDGGPPVEGDLRQEPRVAWPGGTCWWDVSWQ